METEILKKPEFNKEQQEIPTRVKEAINSHLEKKGKPKKFDLPEKEEGTTE